ncbi:MAG TPA: response regulator [Thermoleophilaceae bacterium]
MTDAPASILVVDDDPINRMLLSRELEAQGHRVATVDDGLAALEALRADRFDIVLLDVLMPRLDGYDTLARIEDDERLRNVPVIMVSALEDMESVVRCIEMGAADYLPKPFDPVLLRARINGCLTTKRLRDLERRYLEQERERVRGLFARFVPEAVVDDVLAHADEDLRLGGKRRMATVLISDLRGFTPFAESRPPEVVIEALNRYLSGMSEVILGRGGTLTCFMGDGIMAAFGVPIEQPDHADRALEAAREMAGGALQAFNAWLRDEGIGEAFRMGVGLSSGPVMAGNVGSERRLEYTAIGDTTNTAARLEAMTKETPHTVLMSDSTRSMLTREVSDLVHVDTRRVRGRRAPVHVWSVESMSPAVASSARQS